MSTTDEEKHKNFLVSVLKKVGKSILQRKYVNTIGLIWVEELDGSNTVFKYKIRVKVSDEITPEEKKVIRDLLRYDYSVWKDRIVIDDSDLRRSLNQEGLTKSPTGGSNPPMIQSAESAGNLQWATKGTISGVLTIKGNEHLLSLEHVLVGDGGHVGDDVVCQCLRDIPDFDFNKFKVGKVKHVQVPKDGVEWCLSSLDTGRKTSSYIKTPKGEPQNLTPIENTTDIKIGNKVVKYGVGTEKTIGEISSIHVYASVEEGEFLYGFEITAYDMVNGKPQMSSKPFAGNSDSGSLVLRANENFEPDVNPKGQVEALGILALITEDQAGNELGYAIYSQEIFNSIKKELKTKQVVFKS